MAISEREQEQIDYNRKIVELERRVATLEAIEQGNERRRQIAKRDEDPYYEDHSDADMGL